MLWHMRGRTTALALLVLTGLAGCSTPKTPERHSDLKFSGHRLYCPGGRAECEFRASVLCPLGYLIRSEPREDEMEVECDGGEETAPVAVTEAQTSPATRTPNATFHPRGSGSGWNGRSASGTTMCPDGSYVAGRSCYMCPDGSYAAGNRCRIAPNGSYVGGGNPRLAPDGSYVGGTGRIIMCPDGSYVSGTRCLMTPDGKYVGQ